MRAAVPWAEAHLEVGAVQALRQLLEERHQHLCELLRLHMQTDTPDASCLAHVRSCSYMGCAPWWDRLEVQTVVHSPCRPCNTAMPCSMLVRRELGTWVISRISSSSPMKRTSFWLFVTGQYFRSDLSTGSASFGSFSTNCTPGNHPHPPHMQLQGAYTWQAQRPASCTKDLDLTETKALSYLA